MFKRSILSAAVFAVMTSGAVADSKILEEEIVVTGTRTPVAIYETLASVSVLTRADIEQAQPTELQELLDLLPGIQSRQNGSRGANSSVSVRGTEGDHVLILVDGVRLSSATNGSTALSQIPVSQIERVEVVRGPRSSLYGAEAIAGVIQIFTIKGEGEAKPFVATQRGSHNSQKHTAGVSGASDNVRYSVVANHEETKGFDSTIKDGSDNDDRDGYQETSISANLDYMFKNEWVVGFKALRTEADVEIDQSATDDATETLNQLLTLTVSAPLTDALNWNAGISESRDEGETVGTYPSVYNTQRKAAQTQLDYEIAQGHLLSAGYDFYSDSIESTEAYSETARDNSAMFLQYQGDLGGLTTALNLREDDNEAYGKNTTKGINLGFSVSDSMQLSASYGTGFKAPSFNDLYYPSSDFVFFGTTYRYTGNASVKPEESKSVEIMLRGQQHAFNWSVAIYQTDIKNLIEIEDILNTPTLVISAPSNVSKAELTGTEVNVDFTAFGFNTAVSASYVDPMNADTDEMLTRRSRAKANVNISRDFDALNLAVFWKAESSRYETSGDRLGGFNTLDLRGQYDVTPALSLGFKVDNVFNKDYRILNQYETDGRTYSMSARYQF